MMSTKVYSLKNDRGMEVVFQAHGGRILEIHVPDAKGVLADVVVGHADYQEATTGDAYCGSLCGRFSNRIVQGKFQLDGQSYQLALNNGTNHLHGGDQGFTVKEWAVEPIEKPGCPAAYKLSYVSADGEENYPGELTVEVIYSLNNANEFKIEYTAETNKPTIINLTSHAYFNLSGTGNIKGHLLEVKADEYTPLDAILGTVSGEIVPVEGSIMDLRSPKALGDVVSNHHEQIKMVDGLDHNFVVEAQNTAVPLAAKLIDPASGRVMEVYTDQPGIQVYTGNHFDNTIAGKLGKTVEKYGGVALETQNFPDSPNNQHFPSSVLRPGEKYTHLCIYKFLNS